MKVLLAKRPFGEYACFTFGLVFTCLPVAEKHVRKIALVEGNNLEKVIIANA